MKKILFFCTVILGAFPVSSQFNKGSGDDGYSATSQWQPPFQLEYVREYAGTTPVITNTFNDMFYDIIAINGKSGRATLPLLGAIFSINEDTLKTIDDYNRIMMANDTLNINICYNKHKEKCYHNTYTLVQKNNNNGYGDLPVLQQKYIAKLYNRTDSRGKRTNAYHPNRLLEGMRVQASDTLKFDEISTYDIMVTGNDPLTDRKILEEFCKSGWFRQLIRDEENPDIVVTVSKNANETFSSTYVPPSTQVVNTGSYTRPVYNYITRQTSYVTSQRNKYIQSGGYSQDNLNTSLFLEFTILDAKKLNAPGVTTPPIIWQMTYTRNVANRNFEVIDEYLTVATWNCFPFTFFPIVKVPYVYLGCIEENGEIVSDPIPGSPADLIGLKKGDKIVKTNGKELRTYYKDGGDWKTKKKKYHMLSLFSIYDHSMLFLAGKEKWRNEYKQYNDALYTLTHYYSEGLNYEIDKITVLRNGKRITLEYHLPTPYINKGFSPGGQIHFYDIFDYPRLK